MRVFKMYGTEVTVESEAADQASAWYAIEWAGADAIAVEASADTVCSLAAYFAAPMALKNVSIYTEGAETFDRTKMWASSLIDEDTGEVCLTFYSYNGHFLLELSCLITKGRWCGKNYISHLVKEGDWRHIIQNGFIERTNNTCLGKSLDFYEV
jgi:hypothetical protein